MPETHVFPGGVLSDADFDPRWHELFKSVTNEGLLSPSARFMERRHQVEMFRTERSKSLLPAQIALRLCAIRETFEECGVLLVTNKANADKNLATAETKYTLNLTDWRKRVHKDAGQFINLCESLNMVPNIWSLYEWANWLTPNIQPVSEPPKRPRRFDTMFYVCCLQDQPEARVDKRETTIAEWNTPNGFLDGHESHLAGPQLYELSKLENVDDIEELNHFCVEREPQGVERWMPVINQCADGIVLILPGDDLYPDDPDYNGTLGHVQRTESMLELHEKSQKLNRTFGHVIPPEKLYVRTELRFGYMQPHSRRHTVPKSKSNL